MTKSPTCRKREEAGPHGSKVLVAENIEGLPPGPFGLLVDFRSLETTVGLTIPKLGEMRVTRAKAPVTM